MTYTIEEAKALAAMRRYQREIDLHRRDMDQVQTQDDLEDLLDLISWKEQYQSLFLDDHPGLVTLWLAQVEADSCLEAVRVATEGDG